MSDAWAHNTSMQRATGHNQANLTTTAAGSQLGAQSALAQDESQAEPGMAQAATTLNDAAGSALGALSSLA
jgi:hypothetical protein